MFTNPGDRVARKRQNYSVGGIEYRSPAIIRLREALNANRTYYFSTTGSDSNDGLLSTSPFLTPQRALDITLGRLDLSGYNVTIQGASGTYTGAISMASPQVGAGQIKIAGDTTTPSNVHLNVTGNAITVDGAGCRLFIEGLKVSASSIAGVYVKNGAYVKTTGKNEFGSVTSGHRLLVESALAEFVAAEVISGTVAGAHYYAANNGYIYCQSATWTASGTATQSAAFALAAAGGVIYAFANTPSGTFVGPRYNANLNGVITSNGGGASYFPGNSAGSTSTGGQYA